MVHSRKLRPEYQFDLSGGALCLDFANTISRRQAPEGSTDHLLEYYDLIAFAKQSQVLSPEQTKQLRAHARRSGKKAEATLRRAILNREDIYRVFSALAEGKPAEPDDVLQINDFAIEALYHRRLERADGRYRWEWEWDSEDLLDRILWPIAQSAADLLTSLELVKLRICEAPNCAWLFLDHSRNRSRRWCDMKVCGNRQKARRHYQRTHR